MTKFLNISTDTNLGGSSASDETVSSQKAIKDYVDTGLSGKQSTLTAGTGISISSGTISATDPVLINTANHVESLTIWGDSSSRRNTINIGKHSSAAGADSVMIGAYSSAGEGAFAIGNGATSNRYGLALLGKSSADYAYQLGRGTNSETESLYVGWGSEYNYKLIDKTGIIPVDRISVMTGADGVNAGVKGLVPAPSATSNTKFLRGDGTWADAGGGGGGLPDQTGNAGKFLTTDGTDASWGVVKTHNLFDFKWSDHELNDQSWLNANTFSWQDGTVYSDAYSHLVADYSGGTSKTETIGSHTITFVEATDGHRITTDESTVADIYTESGVAWFYVLDTTNQRFKLPRINPTREELIQIIRSKGNGITLGVTNGTNNAGLATNSSMEVRTSGNAYGSDIGTALGSWNNVMTDLKSIGLATDSTKSGIISSMTDSTSVYKGNLYLYFYVGQFSQSATEQTAGLNASLFNGKADVDLQNVSAGIDFVVESYNNGTEWYRLYKSGWIEQGGIAQAEADLVFLKPMQDTNYTSLATVSNTDTSFYTNNPANITLKTTTGMHLRIYSNTPLSVSWEVKGFSAQS